MSTRTSTRAHIHTHAHSHTTHNTRTAHSWETRTGESVTEFASSRPRCVAACAWLRVLRCLVQLQADTLVAPPSSHVPPACSPASVAGLTRTHTCVHTSCVRSSGEETTQRAAGLTGARLVSPLSPSRNLNGGRSCRRPWRRDAEFQTAKRDISERRRRRRVCGRVSEARAVCAAWRGLINAFVCVQLHKRDTETMSQGA